MILNGVLSHFLNFRSSLTVGKVDGSDGRGSYSGLQDCLSHILTTLKNSNLHLFLQNAEDILVSGGKDEHSGIDLVINGIWVPIAQHLEEKFPNIFNIGIPHVFAHIYRSILNFLHSLPSLFQSNNNTSNGLRNRLQHAAPIASFLQRFKLDLYYSLRVREIMSRLDKACELDTKQLLASYNIPTSTATTSAERLSVEAIYRKGGNSSSSVSKASLDEILNLVNTEITSKCQDPIFSIFAAEMLLCLHNEVALVPVIAKMVVVVERVLLRMLLHLLLISNAYVSANLSSNSSAPENKNSPILSLVHGQWSRTEYEALRQQYLLHSDGAAASANSAPQSPMKSNPNPPLPPATPDAKSTNNAAVPNTPATPSLSKNSSSSSALAQMQMSTDKLLYLLSDLQHVLQWTQTYYYPTFLLPYTSKAQNNVIQRSFLQAMECLNLTLKAMYTHFNHLLAQDCKKALSSIKAIAGKYRMTNKPPPNKASSYVETIFQPIR